MTIKTVESLTPISNVINGIGLCYFDPESEQLIEFGHQEDLYVTPFEESVRRYYLVKNSDLVGGTRPLFASISITSNNSDLEVKLAKGPIRISDKAEYYDVEINNTLTLFFNEYPSGVTPLDLYFKSYSNTYLESDLDIKIITG